MAIPDPAFLLSHYLFPGVWIAIAAFLISFLIVHFAYRSGVADGQAVSPNKQSSGTLRIVIPILLLGLLSVLALLLWVKMPAMQSLLLRYPHLMRVTVVFAVFVFAYLADFLLKVVATLDSHTGFIQKLTHLLVDFVNLIYGISFAVFAVPVLYYIFTLLTGG